MSFDISAGSVAVLVGSCLGASAFVSTFSVLVGILLAGTDG